MTAPQPPSADPVRDGKPRVSVLMLVPLAAFVTLAGLFAVSLNRADPTRLPSTLVGRAAPAFALRAVEGLNVGAVPMPGFAATDLANGHASIVNVWASWCTPCHAEHPYLTDLAKRSGVPLYGINYKDKPEAARRFLNQLGNPFAAIGADDSGRTAIDWGVTGVPETFIVDAKGIVVWKHTGPITPEAIARDLLPALTKAGRG